MINAFPPVYALFCITGSSTGSTVSLLGDPAPSLELERAASGRKAARAT